MATNNDWANRRMQQLVGAVIEGAGVDKSGTPYMRVQFTTGPNRGLHVMLDVGQDAEGNGPGWIHGIPNPDMAEEEARKRRAHFDAHRAWFASASEEAMKKLIALDSRFAEFYVQHTGGGCLSLQRVLDEDTRWVSISAEANIELWTDDAKKEGIWVWVDGEDGMELIKQNGKMVEHQIEFNDPIAALDYALSIS